MGEPEEQLVYVYRFPFLIMVKHFTQQFNKARSFVRKNDLSLSLSLLGVGGEGGHNAPLYFEKVQKGLFAENLMPISLS